MQRRGREEEGPTCGCLEEERKGASEKRTTFEVGVHADPPKKQHLTATPVCAIKQPVFPSPPPITLQLRRSGQALTHR